jgi:ABC-2 type transport system permease protein
VFRNKATMRMMFIMPIIQLVLLPLAANYEVININLAIVDHDRSTWSNQLIQKITATGYFRFIGYVNSYPAAVGLIEHDQADVIMTIPPRFEKDLVKEDNAEIMLSVNAINGAKANIGSGYLTSIIRNYSQDIRVRNFPVSKLVPEPVIETENRYWFNVYMNYQQFMVPGILVILVTMVGSILAAMNIVREKEIGTIEQINVTPIPKYIFIIGKLILFWIMGQFVLLLGMLVGRVVYGVIPQGNIGLIFLFSSVYLLAVLGLGLLISTTAQTQQQAMLVAFFLMMVFILLGGLYTSIDSMPNWAQWITKINPVTYFIEVMRMVVMKGSSLRDIAGHLGIVALLAVVLNTWAVISYRKTA